MRHIDDGTLRRFVDEPLAVSTGVRAHLVSCAQCRARRDQMSETAGVVAGAFGTQLPAVNVNVAFAQMRERTAGSTQRRSLFAPLSGVAHRYRHQTVHGVGALGMVAALVGAATLTPAGSFAQSFISIFQPKSIAVVPVNTADLRKLQGLGRLGTIHVSSGSETSAAANTTAAGTLSGMHVVRPEALPAGVPTSMHYQVQMPATASFTFSAPKARREALRIRKALPAMPQNLNGSTLQVTIGPGVIGIYGQAQTLPALVVGQMKAPTIASTGVSVTAMEKYILSLPEVSPTLAAQIRAIGDPASVLALPIPVDRAHSQPVDVQGVKGIVVGDNTGLGSLIVWEKGGTIYGVGGALTQDQVLAVANSLR